MPPNKLEFELEFLTPTFIGGADPAQKADFNLKALKGAMRYWWRQAQDWTDTQAIFKKRIRDLWSYWRTQREKSGLI